MNIADFFKDVAAYPFLARALTVGILLALCASLLGVCLVLKRFSMIGDGLSHVSFGTITVALATGFLPTEATVVIVLIAAYLLLRLTESGKMRGDAAIALVSSSSLAIGMIAASLSSGMNIDVNGYMFGSIVTTSEKDLIYSVILAVIVIPAFIIFYNKIFALTFDESFAKATGHKTGVYSMVLAALTAITVVVGMKVVGALLISGMIVFPSVSAMRLCKSFKAVSICAAVVSVFSVFLGIVLTYLLPIPAGAGIIIVNLFVFIVFCIIKAIKSWFKNKR